MSEDERKPKASAEKDGEPGRPGLAPPGESVRIRRSSDKREEEQRSSLARILLQAAPYMNAAWMLTAALLLGVLGGRWLDARLDTSPWLMLLGTVLGLVIGFYELVRVALRAQRDSKP